MIFLNLLTEWLRKRIPTEKPSQRPSTRLRLEELEDRVVPSFSASTYTNATVQITPGFTVTEQVTVSVTPFQSFNSSTGQITPIPTGAATPTGGTVLVNLNNMQQSATLNSNGQATATFQVPLLAFISSQTLGVQYLGFTDASGDVYDGSSFLAPVYKNFNNLVFASTLTFNQLTPQQVYAVAISEFQNPSGQPTTTTVYNTANGETDTIGSFAFNYVDPGNIQTVTAFGTQYPGFVAIMLNAYKGLTS
jgi:hypothetical protein